MAGYPTGRIQQPQWVSLQVVCSLFYYASLSTAGTDQLPQLGTWLYENNCVHLACYDLAHALLFTLRSPLRVLRHAQQPQRAPLISSDPHCLPLYPLLPSFLRPISIQDAHAHPFIPITVVPISTLLAVISPPSLRSFVVCDMLIMPLYAMTLHDFSSLFLHLVIFFYLVFVFLVFL